MNEIEAIARRERMDISIIYQGLTHEYYGKAENEDWTLVTAYYRSRAKAILALKKKLRDWDDNHRDHRNMD